MQWGAIQIVTNLDGNFEGISITIPYKIAKILYNIFEKPEWKTTDYKSFHNDFGGMFDIEWCEKCNTKLPAILIEESKSLNVKTRHYARIITSLDYLYK